MESTKPPIACTLDARALATRQEEIRTLTQKALIARERRAASLRLVFRRDADVEAAVRDLIQRESVCCAFLSFALAVEDERLVLDISGPPGSEAVLDAL